MRGITTVLVASWWWALAGCPAVEDTEDTGDPGPLPAEQVDHWCEAVRGGPSGVHSIPVDLSAAHVGVRLFGPEGDWLAADAALGGALDGADPVADELVDAYAAELDSVCAVDAEDGALGAASVDLVGEVAVVVPGAGVVALPEGAAGVVVDLRGLPATDDATQALLDAVGLALAEDVDLGREHHRRYTGHPDQVWHEVGLYVVDESEADWEVPAGGEVDLPLFLFTDSRLGCDAAAVAAGLRLQQRAWIVGYDLFGAQAECEWTGVGERGLAWRARIRELPGSSTSWPDRIPADLSTTTPERVLGELLGWGDPPAVDGEATRSAIARWDGWSGYPPRSSAQGDLRAALVVLHGTLKRFYPYFDVVGDRTDEALAAGLDEVDLLEAGDRVGMVHTIGRFLHVVEDGHAFFGDLYGAAAPDGYLVVQIQRVGGEAWIRDSAHRDLVPGDAIVAIDGVDAGLWYQEVMSRHSAASEGYLFDLATRELRTVYGSRTLTLRRPDGTERTVTPGLLPSTDYDLVPWGGTFRPSGWLTDLGAPDVYHLNLNGEVTTSNQQFRDAFAEIADKGAAGLVVDMRDYPAIDQYELVTYLRTEAFTSPWFHVPVWDGPGDLQWDQSQFTLYPHADSYGGPIVLLVGHKTVSAAENFSLMVVPSAQVTVVGQQSASTNGNITGVRLPGAYYGTFTGMRLLAPDGSTFHGVGIVPDVEVVPTQAQLRDGVDPELLAAVEVLSGE